LDCASHHLFGRYGTHSIEKKEDLAMMEELSYHDSLKSEWDASPLRDQLSDSIAAILVQYRLPTISELFLKIIKPRFAPIANEYVLDCSQKQDAGEQTLIYKLQNSKDNFQGIQMAAECMDHLAAGIDTTGDALCLLMYQLSLPESWRVQDMLFKEFSENKNKSLDDLPYMDAVIKEGLRCFPPIPMSQPRYVPAGGRTIDKYFVPAGVIVSCQAWSVHQLNEDIFVEGNKFLPERWLDAGASLEMNRLFFSFGIGGRGCTGRQ
jgi:cytochrome P450